MFRLSKAAEYSIRGLLQLTVMEGRGPQDIDAISKAQDVPKAYLSKLFQQLAKKGFIQSARGPVGGFILAKSPLDITGLEVVEAERGAETEVAPGPVVQLVGITELGRGSVPPGSQSQAG